MKDAEGTCDVCGEYNTFTVEDDVEVGDCTNTYCPECEEHQEHTVIEVTE